MRGPPPVPPTYERNTLKVKLIAYTALCDATLWDLGYETRLNTAEADELAEFAGRNCYRSFHRPNPKTAKNEDYLTNVIGQGHESVLEHASATFYIETSRSVLTELERHRHLSFSVVSQRYVDPTPLGVHWPPVLVKLPDLDRAYAEDTLLAAKDGADRAYAALMQIFEANGLPRKQAREAARAVLPNMTSSPMVVTGNHRAWRYVIKQRHHAAADAEIRELAGELLRQLREIAPNTYADIPAEPYS